MSFDPIEFLAQLVVVSLVFMFCMKFFFGKLLEVLQQREAKTTLLVQGAEQEMARANEMEGDYRGQIAQAHSRAQEQLKEHRQAAVARGEQAYRTEVARSAELVEKERAKMVNEAGAARQAVLQDADGLATSLAHRLLGESGK